MAIGSRLQKLLHDNEVSYQVLPHAEAMTAPEAAQAAHIPGRQLAKVVALHDSAGFRFLVVIPATEHVDLERFSRITGGRTVSLVPEHELPELFPDCELGAMPPFGHLYGIRTFLDGCLKGPFITFAGGNHRELVHMRLEDLESLEHPYELEQCVHGERPAHHPARRDTAAASAARTTPAGR
ncbi:MAG TPA: YbaK/EbsC family protein [Candidatus Eisenbacteria bacterium]|nr:YbaK/EbsC family protein [Candidatus Eisenbacteria bacterium]